MVRTDYYELLGVDTTAEEATIKSAYRRLALRYHPDRNPGDPAAEEHFKAISEAYAVLSDPQKRAAYNLARGSRQASFGYSQQDIFADLLRRMATGDFRDLGPEFSHSGLRFDEEFLRQVFFSGAPFFMRGFFWSFPGGMKVYSTPAGPAPATPAKPSILGSVGRWVLRQAGKAAFALVGLGIRRLERRLAEEAARSGQLDLTYAIAVSRQEAKEGTTVEISYPRGARLQHLAVKVPPGTRHGTALRLREMGLSHAGQSGDLLVVVNVR